MRFIKQPFAKPIILVIGLLMFSTSFLIGKNSKYRLIWNDAPATTMTIGWHQISGSTPTVFYDVVDHRSSINSYAYSQKVDRIEWFRGMSNQFVRLKNLKPNTVYYFIIKDSEGISKRFWFKTAPNNSNERLSIISGGDSRNHRKSCQNANLLVSKLRPHLVMFGGDMTDNDTDSQWQDWLDDWQLTINADGQMFPIVPARGNHEYSNETIVKLFDAPNSNVYYGLNLGGNLLRAYTLNSLIASGGNQRDWLENDLRQHQDVIWRFAQYHHPIRPHTSRKSDKQELYNNWAKLFYDYQMQLVMECDAHVCKTTYPIRPTYQGDHDMGFIRDDEKGTVYIGEGCWGAPLRPADDNKKWTRASGSFNEFKWIFVDNEKVEIRTIKTDNAASVGELSPNNIFKIPSGLDIWNPPTGSVIHIYNKTKTVASSDSEPKLKENPPVAKLPKSNQPIATTPVAKNKKVENPPKQQIKKTSSAPQLQLTVTNFEVSVEEENLIIRWNTLSAPSNTIFELQRAENTSDIAFQTIKILKIEEDNPNYQTYTLTDNSFQNIQSPFAYYRLKCTSPNGSIYYSEKEVSLGKPWSSFQKLDISSDNWSIFLEYRLQTIEDITVSVFDSKGMPVSQNLYPKQIVGDHLKKVDVMFIQSGKYLIRLNIGKQTPVYFWFEKGA